MKTAKLSATDVLVRRVTAFRDWADMLKSLREGYVPTLRHRARCWCTPANITTSR